LGWAEHPYIRTRSEVVGNSLISCWPVAKMCEKSHVGGGGMVSAPLTRDYSPKTTENLNVTLSTTPDTPFVGVPTQLRITFDPPDGLERYLGAWAHMLAASDDLIDMMHMHPTIADGGPQMQFTVVFPRPRVFRVWLQVQRHGIVNTAHFDIPVRALPDGPIFTDADIASAGQR
jgi:hypothetical protein